MLGSFELRKGGGVQRERGALVSQLPGMEAVPEKKLTRISIQGCQRDHFVPSFLALAPKLSTENVQPSLTYHLMSL